MKKIIFILTVLSVQSVMAADLVIMKFDGRNTFMAGAREKIRLISTSNVNGTNIVNVLAGSTMCQVLVDNLAEGAAIVSAVSGDVKLECYAREEADHTGRILTKEISIVKGL